jgi:hypothetical protein
MKDGAFAAVTVLYVAAIIFACFNRDSEKIVTTLWLGVVALIGSTIAVVLFSSERPIHKVFSVPIIIHADTRLPLEGLPYPVLPMDFAIRVREELTAHPDILPNPKEDSFAQSIYHHALQRAIIYWLEEKYPATWQVDVFPSTLGEISGYSFQSRKVPTRLYRPSELKTKLSGNKFADISGMFAGGDKFGLAVPTGTELTVIAPYLDPARGEVSSVKLHNRFCTITIDTSYGMSMVGAGSYRLLFGMTQLQAQQAMKSDQYVVQISATFNRLLTGNPEMPDYKKWVVDITNGLETQFSDEVVWSKTKDWILFHRIAGQ